MPPLWLEVGVRSGQGLGELRSQALQTPQDTACGTLQTAGMGEQK